MFSESRWRSATLNFTHFSSSSFLLMRSPIIFTGVASITPLRALAQAQDTRGQPLRKGSPGTFEVIGQSLVSAQQVSGDKSRLISVHRISF
jgi:hypothetical protein